MRIALFIVFWVSVEGRFADDIELMSKECQVLESSRAAKLSPNHIDNEVRDAAVETLIDDHLEPWYETSEHQERNILIKKIIDQKFPYHLCNDSLYSPSVERLQNIISCENICRMCFPGSVSICLLRNLNFQTMGETCLCTYSTINPISNAAFSVRHEKRVFSRRF